MTKTDRVMLRQDVEDFLYLEADLLDERRYDEWLELLAEDLEYSMPLRRNVHFQDLANLENTRAGEDILWFDEDKTTLAKRVLQLQTGQHWAEEPLSRVSHLVTNIRLQSVDDDEVVVSCRFLVYRNRVESETDMWVGRRQDTLRRNSDSWKLRRRRLLLEQNVLLAKNLTVFF
jgi:3-phenylpropionate/cinnamic acid dioxygenase small subunit